MWINMHMHPPSSICGNRETNLITKTSGRFNKVSKLKMRSRSSDMHPPLSKTNEVECKYKYIVDQIFTWIYSRWWLNRDSDNKVWLYLKCKPYNLLSFFFFLHHTNFKNFLKYTLYYLICDCDSTFSIFNKIHTISIISLK